MARGRARGGACRGCGPHPRYRGGVRTRLRCARRHRSGGDGVRIRAHASHARELQPRSRSRRCARERGIRDHHRRRPGIMEAANRGARDGGGPRSGATSSSRTSSGRIPTSTRAALPPLLRAQGDVRELLVAFLIFPGGFGTLGRAFEALTLIQTGTIYHFPVIMLGGDEWEGLFAWLRAHALADRRIGAHDLDHLHFVSRPEDVCAIVDEARGRQQATPNRSRDDGRSDQRLGTERVGRTPAQGFGSSAAAAEPAVRRRHHFPYGVGFLLQPDQIFHGRRPTARVGRRGVLAAPRSFDRRRERGVGEQVATHAVVDRVRFRISEDFAEAA